MNQDMVRHVAEEHFVKLGRGSVITFFETKPKRGVKVTYLPDDAIDRAFPIFPADLLSTLHVMIAGYEPFDEVVVLIMCDERFFSLAQIRLAN